MRLILIAAVLAFPVLVFAQAYPRTEISLALSTYDKSVPFGSYYLADSVISPQGDYTGKSYGVGVLARFYRSANTAFRVKAVFYNQQTEDYFETFINGHEINQETFRQRYFRLSPGFQWGLQQNRVEFLGGIEFPLTYVGNTDYSEMELYESPSGPYSYEHNESLHIPGGWGVAAGLFLGSTFHASDWLTFGFEVYGHYGYTSVGGNISSLSETTISAGPTTYSYSPYERRVRITDFSAISALFTAGINF